MKVPPGLLDPQGHVAKGRVHLEANGNEVQEFGLTATGKHSTCFVLASPGDVLTANFALNSGITEEFADLVVDGVLRNSWPNTRGQKVFTYIFDRAVYTGNLIGENKKTKAAKFARMKVVGRNTQKDLPMDGKYAASAVSSIKVQVYRRDKTEIPTPSDSTAETSGTEAAQYGSGSGSGNGDAGGGEATTGGADVNTTVQDLSVAQREPDFIKCAIWQDLNRRIVTGTGTVPPPFEIGFFDSTKGWQKPKERVLKEYTGDYKLWASFTFLLRSTADLVSLGFDDVLLHYSPNPLDSSKVATTGVTQADDSMEVLFVEEDEKEEVNDAPAVEALKKPKKSQAKKKSMKVVEDQPTTSTILDQLAKKNQKGKADESALATSMESKPKGRKSKAETKGRETEDQFIARMKAELVLPGLKSAPAHQAWLERGATEEPEDEEDDIERPATLVQKSGMSEMLSSNIPSAAQTPPSKSQRPPNHVPRVRRRSSPPALGQMTTALVATLQEISIARMPDFNNSLLPVERVFPAHLRHERRQSLPSMASPKPSAPHNREVVPTYRMPNRSDSQRAPTSHMVPGRTPEEQAMYGRSIASESIPCTPVSCVVEAYSMPSFPTSNAQRLLAVQKRRQSMTSMASESTPSTPPRHEEETYLVPSVSTSPRRGGDRLSATTSPGRRQSAFGHNLREPVTGSPTRRFAPINSYGPSEDINRNYPSTFAPSPTPQKLSRVSEGVFISGHDDFDQESLTAEIIKMKSSRTTRPPTPESSAMQTETQPQLEDSEMAGMSRPSSPLPNEHLRETYSETQPRDYEMGGRTRPSTPAPSQVRIEDTQQEQPPIPRPSRPFSPSPSEVPTEAVPEVASPSIIQASRKSSQRVNASPFNNDVSLSQATFSPQLRPQSASFHTPQTSFNHTHESPVLGSSQHLPAAAEVNPLTLVATQASLHWQNRTPLDEILPKAPKVQYVVRVEEQGGNVTYQSAASLSMEPKINPITHSEPMTQPPQASLTSPPPSAQKRKAELITGIDPFATTQSRKIPSHRESHLDHDEFERERAALMAEKLLVEDQLKERQARGDENQRRIKAEQSKVTEDQEQSRSDSQPRWEEEIKRQNEVARARVTAAEQKRKELQARLRSARAVQKERLKVYELNMDAEKLERENAELQATIAALYRGESV